MGTLARFSLGLLIVVVQAALFGVLAWWVASRSSRVGRVVGGALLVVLGAWPSVVVIINRLTGYKASSALDIAGRVDDFTVALRAGSVYSFSAPLNQYWSPATKEFVLTPAAGPYRIAARFEGQGAATANLDMRGASLLNFWKGTVQSGMLDFELSNSPR